MSILDAVKEKFKNLGMSSAESTSVGIDPQIQSKNEMALHGLQELAIKLGARNSYDALEAQNLARLRQEGSGV